MVFMDDYLKISTYLSNIITKDLDYSDEKKEIVTYAIEMLFLTIIGFIAIITVALLFDAVYPAAIAAVFGGILRRVSGGAHFNTPFKCLAIGALVYGIIGILAKYVHTHLPSSLIYLGFFSALFIIGYYAPVDSKEKPINSPILRRNLKIASIVFVIISIIIAYISSDVLFVTGMLFGIAYQAISLLPLFNKRR
ncbi:MAG: accessory gene regulator B family protein [Clostridia bacterium]|nr:accessory gene regulator B family protein [Clostridia bacterium]